MSAPQSPAFIIAVTVRRRKTFGPQDDFDSPRRGDSHLRPSRAGKRSPSGRDLGKPFVRTSSRPAGSRRHALATSTEGADFTES
jgi:hypothetical protein